MLLAIFGGCGAPPVPAPPEPAPRASAAARVGASTPVVVAPTGVPSVAPPSAPPPPPPPPPRFGAAPFPPAPGRPMHPRTAKPDDGKWAPMADGKLPDGTSSMAKTTLHPDKFKKFVFVTIVAFDRLHTSLELVAGTQEPATDTVPAERRPGVVPEAHQSSLLAVFNGGFKNRHGGYGMFLNGDLFIKARDEACTVVADQTERLRIAPWPTIAGALDKPRYWRQTPPCMIENGTLHPRLSNPVLSKRYGLAKGGAMDIRRSAIGLDASGRALMYGFGDWVEPIQLAKAMEAAGAVQVAQLDINWSYTRFFLFEQGGAGPRIRETLIPKLKFHRDRYTRKASYRDFFYVRRRPARVQ